MPDAIKVGVLILHYNHEKYIVECLNSIVVQKTAGLFTFDIIITDDCSSDNSLKLIDDFGKQHPDVKITILNSVKRMGVFHNVMKLFDVNGYDYYALMDGDDFWNYDEKLYQQIQFLENNSDYVGTCHDSLIQHEDANAKQLLFSDAKNYSQQYSYRQDIFPWDILSRMIIPTSSIVFRVDALKKVDKKYLSDAYSLAWKITVFLIRDSKFRYFNQPWSTYRNHSKGVSKSNVGNFHQSHIQFFKTLLKDSYYKYNKYWLYKAICFEYFTLIPIIKNESESSKVPLKYNIDYLLCELKAAYYSLLLINK